MNFCPPEWLQIAKAPIPNEAKAIILSMVWQSHVSATNSNVQNASNVAVSVSATSSLSVVSAIASGVLAMGGLHAPITAARNVIFRRASIPIPNGMIVPGFGNSFWKDRIDPAWQGVADHIQSEYPDTWAHIQDWSNVLLRNGSAHLPNAAALTAAVAEIVDWPLGAEAVLAIQPRISLWGALFTKETQHIRLLQ